MSTGPEISRWVPGDPPPTPMQLDALAARTRTALAWRESLTALSGEGEHEGVAAVVGSSGALTDLKVPDRSARDGGEEVSRRVLEAIGAAQRDLAEQIRASAREAFGEDSDDAATVSASLETRFPGTARVLPPDEGTHVTWGR
ncbi:hypothetical protein [Pedococcus soli]